MPTIAEKSRKALKEAVLRPMSAEEMDESSLLARLSLIENMGMEVFESAVKAKDARNAAAVMGQLLRAAELRAKQSGELVDKRGQGPTGNSYSYVMVMPQVPDREVRGVLAAPVDGGKVSPAVADRAIDLEVLEAERGEDSWIPAELTALLDRVSGHAPQVPQAASEPAAEAEAQPVDEAEIEPERGFFAWNSPSRMP
ncbi:MAG: hypothetical protein QM757_26490 [Paludibaculum sp.]